MPYYLFYYGDEKGIKHILCSAKNKKKLYNYLINNIKKFEGFFEMFSYQYCENFNELYDPLLKLSTGSSISEIEEELISGLRKINHNYFFNNITMIGGNSCHIDDLIIVGFKKIRSKNFLEIN
ncbi:hypothetical protein ma130 [Moumouvirus australiensis]|uniref:Uncharacterized protein n=1 Tax=Moumouvirus australiensis TaxID=2109587 RepID=A0A2P1EKV3_9VIRU|nr:hypothetical protein QKC55_gp774 [Moumouvirus australiensis]AVL94516.1 hypothetical protein ma130 [Moumouvirus australiensis]